MLNLVFDQVLILLSVCVFFFVFLNYERGSDVTDEINTF